MNKIRAGGILPFITINRALYVILGENNNDNKLSDFGGLIDREPIINGTLHEFIEESMNLIDVSIDDLNKSNFVEYDIYRMYCVDITAKNGDKIDSIINMFNNIATFTKENKTQCPEGFLEVANIKMIELNQLYIDIESTDKIKYRTEFKENLIQNKETILHLFDGSSGKEEEEEEDVEEKQDVEEEEEEKEDVEEEEEEDEEEEDEEEEKGEEETKNWD